MLRAFIVDRFPVQPARSAAMGLARGLAVMHHGRLNAYVAYVLLTPAMCLIIAGLM